MKSTTHQNVISQLRDDINKLVNWYLVLYSNN